MALAVTSTALASANGQALGPAFQVAQVHSKQLRVAAAGTAGSANTQQRQQQQQSEGSAVAEKAAAVASASGGDQEPGGGVGGAGGGPPCLPRRADVVLHEIFGTDPLSEHILPSMAHVQVGGWVRVGAGNVNVRCCMHSTTISISYRRQVLPSRRHVCACRWAQGLTVTGDGRRAFAHTGWLMPCGVEAGAGRAADERSVRESHGALGFRSV